MIAGGNSTFREFLTYYNIGPDTPINIKYLTRAAEYYRNMLSVIADRKTYDVPFPDKSISSQVIEEEETKESGIKKFDNQDLETLVNPQVEKSLMGTESTTEGVLSSMFSKVVGLGSSAKEKVEELKEAPVIKSIESKTHSAVETVSGGVSRLVEMVKETFLGQSQSTESEISKRGYLDVAESKTHNIGNIDSNPIVISRKNEIMNYLGQFEGEKGPISFTQETTNIQGASSLIR